MSQEKHGVCAGKFRLIHLGHKEYLIRALDNCDHLHVIICDTVDASKRYASLVETQIAIGAILKKYETPYTIHIAPYEEVAHIACPSQEWDEYVERTVGVSRENIVVFDSKEEYGNTFLENKYLKTRTPLSVSASDLEKAPLDRRNAALIVPEFMRFMNKKVVVTGIESCGKTTLVKKLADYYQTAYSEEYGRYYSAEELGGEESAFQPKDFVHIADTQLLQDKQQNKVASRLLLVDTDPIVTLYYLKMYSDHYMNELTIAGYNLAEAVLTEKARAYTCDLVLYMSPKVKFVHDGLRWLEDPEERKQKDIELLEMYQEFDIPVVVIEEETYEDRFDKALEIIEKTLNIN